LLSSGALAPDPHLIKQVEQVAISALKHCLPHFARLRRTGIIDSVEFSIQQLLNWLLCGCKKQREQPTIDWEIESGTAIPIERRDAREVTHIEGCTEEGRRVAIRLTPLESPAANYAFDVTPACLVTECGICSASREGLLDLFPERRRRSLENSTVAPS
jgi:hypothetical protein